MTNTVVAKLVKLYYCIKSSKKVQVINFAAQPGIYM